MRSIITIISIALFFTSCEKIVDLKYKDNQPKLIIEGNITNEPGPYFVKISKSIGLKETGENPVVDNAIVSISDDVGNTEILPSQGNGVYQCKTLRGLIGRTYTLTVQADNQIYIAQSTMPEFVLFDSIKVDQVVSVGGNKEYNLIPVYNDPLVKGNNYRFMLSINKKLINQHFIQNDELKNGGTNTLRIEVNDENLKLKSGDSISITMQNIDRNVALYYNTLALIANSGPGGGTTPTNPPNNLSNGALGLFSAHTMQTKVTIVP